MCHIVDVPKNLGDNMTSTQLPSAERSGEGGCLSHQQIYETDFVEWINKTAELLKQGKFSELDIENLIEEVESLGRSEKNALKSNLSILLMHLLKWQYQPSKRTDSWLSTIIEHRDRLQLSLESSPSLRNYYIGVFEQRYAVAKKKAVIETGLEINIFPIECPYSVEQVLDDKYLPE